MGVERRPRNNDEEPLVYESTLKFYIPNKKCQNNDLAYFMNVLWCMIVHPGTGILACVCAGRMPAPILSFGTNPRFADKICNFAVHP